MSRKSFIALPLGLAGALLLAGPVAADQMVVEGHQVYQERVSHADLDLRRSGDRQRLNRRVERASDRVCIAAEGPGANYAPFRGPHAGMTCSDLTYKAARPQIAAAVDRARRGEAIATALVVVAPARAR